MITVEMSGGLGNQMFQYAIVIKLRYLGKDVRVRHYFPSNGLRRIEIGCFRGIAPGDLISYDESETGRLSGIINVIKNRVYPTTTIKDKIIHYQPDVFEHNNAILEGYWQNEKYFSDIRQQILDVFTFKKELQAKWNRTIDDTYCSFAPEGKESVSVHVRRSDYLDFTNIYGGICTVDYYHNAITYMKERLLDPVFYFFSDDIEWVRSVLIPELRDKTKFSFEIVSNEYEEVGMDMWLMTRCRHHIIANSTYSWWGAWLGTNPDKIVTAPPVWMNGYSDDIICSDWVKIRNDATT